MYVLLLLCVLVVPIDTAKKYTLSNQPCWRSAFEYHNQVRAAHGANPLQWDQGFADEILKEYTDNGFAANNLGNSAMVPIPDPDNIDPCKRASMMWYAGNAHYNYDNPDMSKWSEWAEFTQMVYKPTTRMGLAYATDEVDGYVYVMAKYDVMRWKDAAKLKQFVGRKH